MRKPMTVKPPTAKQRAACKVTQQHWAYPGGVRKAAAKIEPKTSWWIGQAQQGFTQLASGQTFRPEHSLKVGKGFDRVLTQAESDGLS